MLLALFSYIPKKYRIKAEIVDIKLVTDCINLNYQLN